MNNQEQKRLREIEVENHLLNRSEEIFKAAWHEADKLGMRGHRTRYALKALVEAGFLVDLSAWPLHFIDGFGVDRGPQR